MCYSMLCFLSLHSDARSWSNLRKINTKNYLVKVKTFEQKNSFCTANSWFSLWEKNKLKTGKNLLVLSKSLLVTIAKTWNSLRFSVSQKVFNTSKFWLILSKNFLDLGMEFVYEKMTAYKIVSPRKSIFSMRTFSTLKQLYNKRYIHFFITIK